MKRSRIWTKMIGIEDKHIIGEKEREKSTERLYIRDENKRKIDR